MEGKPCLTLELWFGLNETIHEYLGKINLQQLVDVQAKRGTPEAVNDIGKFVQQQVAA
jgi:DNA-binding IscR family transcriptional regulator